MGSMVYSLLWVMQDFVHQPYHSSGLLVINTGEKGPKTCILLIRAPFLQKSLKSPLKEPLF